MASTGAWKWAAVFGSIVLAVPLVCCVASTGLDKLLRDDPRDTTPPPALITGPEPGTAEYYEQRQRPAFLALRSPSWLVVSARGDMAMGWDPWLRIGGHIDRAAERLAHIPATAPESAEATVLRAEINARLARAGTLAPAALHNATTPEADIEQPLTAFMAGHFGSGRFVRSGDTLRLDHPLCSNAFLDPFITAGRDALRSHGIRGVGCATGAVRTL